jgi:heptosyltransferase-1
LITGAALVVGVDTGLLHLAAALGVPLVAIFVGSDPALTGPIGAAPIAIVGGKGRMPAFDELLAAVEKVA